MNRKSPEHDLQKRCVSWFKYQYPHLFRLFFSVPNGGSRNKAEAGRLKAEGMNPGVADLILLVPNYYYHSLNIEMKAGSKQSEDQKIYEAFCQKAGNQYVVCKSFEQFKSIIEDYLSCMNSSTILTMKSVHKTFEEAKAMKAKEKYKKLCNKTKKDHESK